MVIQPSIYCFGVRPTFRPLSTSLPFLLHLPVFFLHVSFGHVPCDLTAARGSTLDSWIDLLCDHIHRPVDGSTWSNKQETRAVGSNPSWEFYGWKQWNIMKLYYYIKHVRLIPWYRNACMDMYGKSRMGQAWQLRRYWNTAALAIRPRVPRAKPHWIGGKRLELSHTTANELQNFSWAATFVKCISI